MLKKNLIIGLITSCFCLNFGLTSIKASEKNTIQSQETNATTMEVNQDTPQPYGYYTTTISRSADFKSMDSWYTITIDFKVVQDSSTGYISSVTYSNCRSNLPDPYYSRARDFTIQRVDKDTFNVFCYVDTMILGRKASSTVITLKI